MTRSRDSKCLHSSPVETPMGAVISRPECMKRSKSKRETGMPNILMLACIILALFAKTVSGQLESDNTKQNMTDTLKIESYIPHLEYQFERGGHPSMANESFSSLIEHNRKDMPYVEEEEKPTHQSDHIEKDIEIEKVTATPTVTVATVSNEKASEKHHRPEIPPLSTPTPTVKTEVKPSSTAATDWHDLIPPNERIEWEQFKIFQKELESKQSEKRSGATNYKDHKKAMNADMEAKKLASTTTTKPPKILTTPKTPPVKAAKKQSPSSDDESSLKTKYHIKNVEENQHPEDNRTWIECTPEGAILWDKHSEAKLSHEKYTVCTESFCFRNLNASEKTEIALPAATTIHDHAIRWKIAVEKDYKIIQKTCPARDFCNKINCYICWELLANPSCHTFAIATMLIVLVGIVALFCCCGCYHDNVKWATRSACHSRAMRICKWLGGDLLCGFALIWEVVKYIRRKCRRRAQIRRNSLPNRRVLKDMELDRLRKKEEQIKLILSSKEPIRRNRSVEKNLSEDLRQMNSRSHSVDSVEAGSHRVSWKPDTMSRSSSKSSMGSTASIWKPKKLGAMTLLVILCTLTKACDEIISLSHSESICRNGVCNLTSVLDATFNNLQRVVCVQISSNDTIYAKFQFEMQYIYLVCEPSHSKFAYNSTVSVEAKQFCDGVSGCEEIACRSISRDARIPGLVQANNFQGYSYCVPTCGSIICSGCWKLSAKACSYYRTFAKPNHEAIFELFACDEWTHSLRIKISKWQYGSNETVAWEQDILIQAGESIELIDEATAKLGKIIATSIDTKEHPIKSSHFIRQKGGDTLSKVDRFENQIALLTNEFGNVTKYQETCMCMDGGEQCKCKNLDLFAAVTDPDRSLPILEKKFEVIKTASILPAIKSYTGTAEIQILFDAEYRIDLWQSTDCQITDYSSVIGCVNCRKKASFYVVCRSTANSSAILKCEGGEKLLEYLMCNSTGYKNQITRAFTHQVIDDNCLVKCGRRKRTIHLAGELTYVPPESLSDVMYALQGKHHQIEGASLKDFPNPVSYLNALASRVVYFTGSLVLILLILWILFKCIIPCCVKLAVL